MKQEQRKLGIYVHIPFCKHKCDYCDFYSLPDSENRMDEYVKALTLHLTETAPRAGEHMVDTVYFGGGTPTLLGAKRLGALLSVIKKKYNLAGNAEITLEANPESAQNWRELRAIRRAGFNRISLGMQSATDSELQSVGRIHSAEQTQLAVEHIRKAKIKNLSLDLIYGLPDQSLESWKTSLAAAVALAPEHLSCYGLKVEEGTPLCSAAPMLRLPDDDMQADMYLYTVDFLKSAGYEQYEISNFAKPNYESRHNMKYWTLGEYAGFGPGAHSDFGGVRYAYVRNLDKYIGGVLRGEDMLSENESIPARLRDTEYLMLRLRTVAGISPKEFESLYRMRFDPLFPTLEKYRALGYAVQTEAGEWHLTPTGFLISNTIIGDVLESLAAYKAARKDSAVRGDFRIV